MYILNKHEEQNKDGSIHYPKDEMGMYMRVRMEQDYEWI